MSKSLLYAVNTASQTVAVGGTIGLGTPVRRYGCNCTMEDGNLKISGNGYYIIDADITITPSADGEAVITLYKDGTAIPGAVVSQYITTDGAWTLHIPNCAVRENGCCCNNSSVVTAVLTGVAGSVSLTSVLVTKE